MKTIEYSNVDKSKWGGGPWQTEPDKKQWLDRETGLPCLIVRNRLGALCGYVGVPKSHPWFGLGYDELEGVDVHGGLTFAGPCSKGGKECESVCHSVEPGEDDEVWWLGFDAAHGGDICPGLPFPAFGWAAYRDFDYVTAEVQKLAGQIHDAQ